MKVKILFLIFFFSLSSSEYVSYKDYKVYKITPRSEQDVKVLTELESKGEYTFWDDILKQGHGAKIMVSPEKQDRFVEYMKSVGMEGNVVIEDVQRLIEAQLQRPQLNRINNNYDWNFYLNLEEIHQWMDDIEAAHPNVARVIEIGNSAEGRAIKGIVIDYKRQANPVSAMIEGGIHAREWISPATVTYIINEFLTSNDPEIRALAENVVWHLFPVVNPDGYEYTFTTNRMWRKNRNPLSAQSCSEWGLSDDMSNGIDLNRNFNYLWMSTGASSNPCTETFAGPVANSELETRAIINYVNTLQTSSNLVTYYAFHSFSQMVLVPYSHVTGADVLVAANYGDMFEIAAKGMDKLKQRNGTEYEVGTSADILYPVSGSSFDWVKGVADVPIVYLFELRDTGEFGFLLPPKYIIDNNREIMDGLVEMDRVTRQMGYYHRSGAIVYTLHFMLIILSLIINI